MNIVKTFLNATVLSAFLVSAAYAYDENPTPQDIQNWTAAARQGNAEAQFNLGEAYLKGEGVEKDEKEASKWYYKAAMQGYTEAQFAMGFVYRGGSETQMDKILSYMWFDLAAHHGDTRAFELRNDVASSMTEEEIEEARKRSREWKPE